MLENQITSQKPKNYTEEEESWMRNLINQVRGIRKEESERRNHEGGIMEEES